MKEIIYTCDKCGSKKKSDELYTLEFNVGLYNNYSGNGFANTKKDYCRHCLENVAPGTFAKGPKKEIQLDAIRKTVAEQFEDLIREICQEEIGGN